MFKSIFRSTTVIKSSTKPKGQLFIQPTFLAKRTMFSSTNNEDFKSSKLFDVSHVTAVVTGGGKYHGGRGKRKADLCRFWYWSDDYTSTVSWLSGRSAATLTDTRVQCCKRCQGLHYRKEGRSPRKSCREILYRTWRNHPVYTPQHTALPYRC